VVLTEWKEFKDVDFSLLKGKVRVPLIVDFRNLFQPEIVIQAGFTYHSLGRAAKAAN